MQVSIITPVLNASKTISRCIESVDKQTWPLEHIVVDGGSTDGTVDYLENRRNLKLQLIVNHDDGVYDAMNRGLAIAKGEWILFLGADDFLSRPTILEEILSESSAIAEADLILASAEYIGGKKVTSRLNGAIALRNTIHHQGCLYRRRLFQKRLFDPRLRVYGDYEFNIYLFRNDAKTHSTSKILSYCSLSGLSDSPRWKNYLEEIQIRHRYFNFFQSLIFDILTFVRFGIKKILKLIRPPGGTSRQFVDS